MGKLTTSQMQAQFHFYSVNRPVSKLAYCNFLKLLYSTYVFVAEDVLNDINAVISPP